MKSVELLAPAKNIDVAKIAIDCGADAIYIGADTFGARHNATNSIEDIKNLVNYAHKFYVRVHVTINTILNDFELKQAVELIEQLYKVGVDAIIVQDMGIIDMAIKGLLPPIQIHASTQCNNRTLAKAKFFDEVGLSRVILARELSLDKIKEICENTSCEIETFIHGALCVCYSGQCYLSYANGYRSANKGECAQPCRKKYSLIDSEGNTIEENKYLLSLKDFNASEHIEQLIKCGVNSFKIEGRLKDSSYVANVVLFYNNLLNKYAKRSSSGKVFTDITPDINKTFNRGYTDYFLKNRTDCFNKISPKHIGEYIGCVSSVTDKYIVANVNVNPQDGITYFVDNDTYGFLVNKVVGNKIFPNKFLSNLKVGMKLYRNTDSNYLNQLNKLNISRKIGVSFIIRSDKLLAVDEDNNRVSINFDNFELANNQNLMKENLTKQLSKLGNTDFYLLKIEYNAITLPFVSIANINKMRRNLLTKLCNERLRNYKSVSQKPMKYSKIDMTDLDYKFNILNKNAVNFYKQCKSCVNEYALEYSKQIKSGIELMRCKHCIKYSCGLCGKATKQLFLLDKENNKKYPLVFDCKNCEMVVLNP